MYQTAFCEESYSSPEGGWVPLYTEQMAGGVGGGGRMPVTC